MDLDNIGAFPLVLWLLLKVFELSQKVGWPVKLAIFIYAPFVVLLLLGLRTYVEKYLF